MSAPPPELIRLRRQAAKRFHPDNAIDAEDGLRLTRLMQEANAAFDARDEDRLRAVFAPPQPLPPQPPPNAWGPRTYQQQTPPKAHQQPTQASAQPAQPSSSFKAWFWIVWGLWSVSCLIVGNGWLIFVGLFASIFIAQFLIKVQHWFRTKTTNSTTQGQQSVSSRGRFKGWFWITWAPFLLTGIIIGSIGKPNTRLNDVAALTGGFYILGGVLLGFTVARYRLRIAQWTKTQRASGMLYEKVGAGAGIGFMLFLLSMLPIMATLNKTYEMDPAAASGYISPIPRAATGVMKLDPGTPKTTAPVAIKTAPAHGTFNIQAWGGTYTGTVHNNGFGVDADITVTIDRQTSAAINGYFSVKRPLYGSGPLTGASVINDTIEFHVVPPPVTGFELDFRGHRTGPGVVSGTYSVSNGQSGTFTMHLSSVTAIPVQKGAPFDLRYGWYVEEVKNKVAQNWYLKEVTGTTPAGSTVYVQFQIRRQGYPDDVVVKTGSGYYSLDVSCLNAVKRTSFDPLPASYDEESLNVVYHCTYPGGSYQSSLAPAVASYNPQSLPSSPPIEPVVPPVGKNWLDYINVVDALIDQRWRKTAYAGHVSPGETAVRFTVSPSGLVGDATVTISSGSPVIDAACKAVVGDPMGWYAPRLPEGYTSPVFLAYVCK